MKESIQAEIDKIDEAKEKLEALIFDEISAIASHNGLVEVFIGPYGNTYETEDADGWRQEVDCQEIEDLDMVYCTHVNDGGFQALWRNGVWV